MMYVYFWTSQNTAESHKKSPSTERCGGMFLGGQWAANLSIFTQPHQTTLCIQSWHGELFHVKHMNGRGG